jgi:hypothetical protein
MGRRPDKVARGYGSLLLGISLAVTVLFEKEE